MSDRLGELVVVAIEAKNLSTRENFGKGDPFVAFHVDGESKRIKAEKRGGQHPQWDEEVRFNLKKNTSKKMKIQVFNEDKREPILIGDGTVELSEVLDKTECDAWYEIRYRNKYAGEVSLEMTFYYAERPPSQAKPHPTHATSLPPTNQPPVSAPPASGYPPQNAYPPPNSKSPPPPSNVYPPPNSKSPPPPSNVYPPPQNVYSSTPPSSKPPQFDGPKRTQSPASSQYPPASSSGSGYPPVYPPQSQGYPPVAGSYPPVSSPPHSGGPQGNLAFPVPVPTPDVSSAYNAPYPPAYNAPLGGYHQQPPSYPPNNIYPPQTGGYPPTNQGYPPNPYPPNPYPPNAPY